MKKRLSLFCAGTALGVMPAHVLAQEENGDQQPPVQEQEVLSPDGTIVVRGERLRGQLNVEQAPILELNEEDIAATGAGSITELLEAISPQTGGARGRGGGGRPVLLVNGIRIASFREFRSYPPEAVARVEVMPEEVAQRFGFPPDRRVVNFILKPDFASREVEVEYEQPADGGFNRTEIEGTLLRISESGRLNLNAEYERGSELTEAERGIIQTPGSIPTLAGDPDPAAFRTLVGEFDTFQVTANYARAILESGSSISGNATYLRSVSVNRSGLNSVLLTAPDGTSALRTFDAANPLERRSDSDTFSAAASWERPLLGFQFTLTGDASHTRSATEIDRRADTSALVADAAAGIFPIDGTITGLGDPGFDTAKTRTTAASTKGTLRGSLADLPGGELTMTLDTGYDWDRIASDDTRTVAPVRLTRGDLSGGVNLAIPITSRRRAFADALGSFTLNLQGGVNDLSDFGTLTDYSVAFTWSPFDNLDLTASRIVREVAPGLSQLGAPEIVTLNVPTFDLTNGETVLATITSGGNPALLAETQKDWRFAANWELPFWENTRLSVDYARNRSSDVTSGFPALLPEIEAAFPGRVTRDAAGTLLAIDRRPVTFAATRSERIVLGLSTRGSFGTPTPRGGEEAGGRPAGARPSGGKGGPPRGRGQRFGGGGPGGRPGGPPSPEQRAAFMQFRERLCAEDGEQVLVQLAEALDRGESLDGQFPGFDPERAAQMLERFRAADGTIDRERLAQFRERICSFDPASMGRGGPPGQQGGEQAQGGPPQGAGQRGGGGAARFGLGGRGDGRGRYFISLSHTIELENEILVALGGPLLDQLEGQGLGGAGLSRHSTRLEAGAFRNGWGMRLSGRYTGSSRLEGSGLPGSTDLFFGDLARLDVRLFADLGRILEQEDTFLKNLRVSLRADNVFDGRRRVTDANGDTPLAFQPFLVDPVGRYLGIEVRKLW